MSINHNREIHQLDEEIGLCQQDINQANTAKQVVEHPLFKDAFDKIRADTYKMWLSSGGNDEKLRERAYQITKVTDQIEAYFKSFIVNGQVSEAQLASLYERKNTLSKLFRR